MNTDNTNENRGLTLVSNNESPNPSNQEAPTLSVITNPDVPQDEIRKCKLVRLITGEVVMGWVTPNGNHSISVEKARLVVMMTGQGDNGQPMVNLEMVPYMPYSKTEKFTFRMDMILNQAEPVDGLKKEYITRTSGIIT